MISLAPIRGERDYGFRWALADAIVQAYPGDEQMQRTEARIAWLESGFRRSVARCEVKGDGGKSLGVFQVKPIERGDAERACSRDLRVQALLAREYIERSAKACPENEGADSMAVYVSGRCTKGLRQARERWEPDAPPETPRDALPESGAPGSSPRPENAL